MPDILKGSFIVSFILKVIYVLKNAYDKSILKKFVQKAGICFKNSITRKILASYVNKNPWYRYSFTYKIVFVLANAADKIFGGIFAVVKAMLKGSFISDSFKKAFNMSLTDKCYSGGVLLISLPVGVLSASIVFESFTMFTFVICWAMFFVGIMVVITGLYGKDSIIVRLIRGFIAIIK